MFHMKYYLSVIAAVVLWGSSFIATKIALGAFSPLLLCMARFVLASVLLATAMKAKGCSFAVPKGRDLLYILASSLCGISIYYAIENIGLSLTSAADASVISASYPAICAITGVIMYKAKLSLRMMAGILLAMAGVVVMNGTAQAYGEGSLPGNLLLIFDGFMWAQYNYLTKRISPAMGDVAITFWQMLAATVMFIPALFLEKNTLGEITSASVFSLAYLSGFCTVAALGLYNYGLRKVNAEIAAVLMNLMPIAGLILSVLVLHEKIAGYHVAGIAIIILGVLLSSR